MNSRVMSHTTINSKNTQKSLTSWFQQQLVKIGLPKIFARQCLCFLYLNNPMFVPKGKFQLELQLICQFRHIHTYTPLFVLFFLQYAVMSSLCRELSGILSFTETSYLKWSSSAAVSSAVVSLNIILITHIKSSLATFVHELTLVPHAHWPSYWDLPSLCFMTKSSFQNTAQAPIKGVLLS